MSNLINLEANPSPATLYSEEIQALAAVVSATLDKLVGSQASWVSGALTVEGQATNQPTRMILHAKFPGGLCPQGLAKLSQRSPDEVVSDSIDGILAFPDTPYYWRDDEEIARCSKSLHIPTKIYRDGDLRVLVLNTTAGRFLMSVCAINIDHADEISAALMYAMAHALAQMGLEDLILQRSAARLDNHLATSTGRYSVKACQLVEDLFRQCDIPEIMAWRSWHNNASESDGLKLFFES